MTFPRHSRRASRNALSPSRIESLGCDFTREVTYGYRYATKPDLRLVVAKDTPTKDELSKHASRFGQAGVRELVAALPAEDNGLSRKSELAELKEKARKRSKWRRNLEQEARLLLERKPDLLPMAVADVLNITVRRAKSLLTKIVVGSQA